MSQELGWVLCIGFACSKVASPVLVEKTEYIIADLAWQCLRGFMMLDEMENLCITQALSFVEKELPDDGVGCIVEILGGKSGTIYRLLAWIALVDRMLFNKLHPLPPIPVRSFLSCVSLVSAHKA